MDKIVKYGASVLVACTLAACSGETSSSVMTVESTDENTIEIVMQDAEPGTGLSGYIAIGDGEHLVVEPAMESGSLTMRWVPAEGTDEDNEPDFEGKDLPNPPTDYVISGTEREQYSVEYPEIYILFTVSETASGKVHIYATSDPYEETADDGQNPVMNFVGIYGLDRASVTVEPGEGNTARFTVHWASSAAEFSEWVMNGEFDPDTLTVTYTDGTKTNYVYNANGEVESSEPVYDDGTGTITFRDGDPIVLEWNDEKEHIADGAEFTWVPAAE